MRHQRGRGDLGRRPVVRWLVALALAASCTGCAGKPASASAWQSTSDRALGALISSLGTARIVVVGESRDRMPHSYATRAVTDAITSGDKEISSFLVGQPPDSLHRAHQAVTSTLQDALALLVEVRVALASPGLTTTSAKDLVARIDAMRKRLDSVDSAVQEAPSTVGAR